MKNIIEASILVKKKMLDDTTFIDNVSSVVALMVKALEADGKIWFCGNGGSAADAQHIAAELTGRFYKDRKPLFAEALHVNSSYLTAVANDYGYDEVYRRLVEGKCRKGDVLFAISTSGNSKNIVLAAEQAKKQGVLVVGMTGEFGGDLTKHTDILLNVPSNDTPRIQEAHILIGHILCEYVENEMF